MITTIRTDRGKTTMRIRMFAQVVWLAIVTAMVAPRSDAYAQTDQPSQASRGNLASAAEVSVSSEQNGFPKAHAIDGNRSTEWASTGGHPWIALRWKEPLRVGRFVLCDRADPANRAQGGKVLFSDGSTLDVDDIPPGGAPCEVRFEPRTVRWLRLDLFTRARQELRPGGNPGVLGRRKGAETFSRDLSRGGDADDDHGRRPADHGRRRRA